MSSCWRENHLPCEETWKWSNQQVIFAHVQGKTHWDDVRLLLALGRSRHLGEAGRRLGLDPSTVSRRLTALEAVLGATLFERGRSGIEATDEAHRLMVVAEEIEHGMARFSGTVDALEREVSGTVRLSCPPDAAEVLLVPLLPGLRALHPGLRIQLIPSEAVLDLSRRAADLALRIVRPEQGDLQMTRLRSVPWVAAGSPDYAASAGALRKWQDVDWMGWGDGLAQIGPARWLHEAIPNFDPILRSDSIKLQISAVARGLGAALLPEPSVAHFGLVPLELAPRLRRTMQPWPTDELYLVMPRALRQVPRVRAVWSHLVEELRQVHHPIRAGRC